MKSLENNVDGEKILLREKAKRKLVGSEYFFDKFFSPLVLAMSFPVLILVLALFPDDAEKYIVALLISYLFFMAFLWIYKLQNQLKSIVVLMELDGDGESEKD